MFSGAHYSGVITGAITATGRAGLAYSVLYDNGTVEVLLKQQVYWQGMIRLGLIGQIMTNS